MATTDAPTDDRYLTLEALHAYGGLSVRALQRALVAPVNPLPHFKIGGRILVRRSDYDRWIERVGTPEHIARARTTDEKVHQAVNGILGRDTT
jgi:hypothetical protein